MVTDAIRKRFFALLLPFVCVTYNCLAQSAEYECLLYARSGFGTFTTMTRTTSSALTTANIRDMALGCPVTRIGARAFAICPKLKTVNLSSYLELIDIRAFENCRYIQKITLPSKMQIIGARAFEGCVKLASINFPSGMQTIQRHAFHNCTSLTEIVLPNTITELGSGVFEVV